MSQDLQPREEEPDVESDEPRHPDPDVEGEESPADWAIIPGNVGSLDDVPPDLLKEGVPTVDDEGM